MNSMIIILLFTLIPLSGWSQSPSGAAALRYNYARMFEYSRKLLTRPPIQALLSDIFASELEVDATLQEKFGFPERLKSFSEPQFVMLLQENPSLWPHIDDYLREMPEYKEGNKQFEKKQAKWNETFRTLLSEKRLQSEFRSYNDPTTAFELQTPNGESGYSELQFYVNHERPNGRATRPADNLKQVWIDFLRSAQKEIVLNIYEFDLLDVARVLVDQKKRGLSVRIGVDAGVIEAKPELQHLLDYLTQNNVDVTQVDAVGLNHQKMAAIDFSDRKKARVLLSSGNLTQSCLGPEGDLPDIHPRPDYSIPNANHVITLKSYNLATLINHELTKTLDSKLRGKRQYVYGGSYKILGAPAGNLSPELVIAFTPNGGLGNVNKHLISKMLLETDGPIRMVQFAFSSSDVEEALLARARRAIESGHAFDFKSVGDTSFAMREWSSFLTMSGLKKIIDGERATFEVDAESPWRRLFTSDAEFEQFTQNIRSAPPLYGTHSFTLPDGKTVDVTAKVHDKVMMSGDAAIVGSSFNFSAGAEKNNEQLVIFRHDPFVTENARSLFEGLYKKSRRSVVQVATQRNCSAALLRGTSIEPLNTP